MHCPPLILNSAPFKKMASKRGSDTFKHKWLLECGVEISARDIESSKPISAVCKFCKTFGKEQAEDNKSRKQKQSQNIQLFKKPWRADKMKEHNKRMHKTRWQEYQTLSDMEKKAYFVDNAPPPANSVLRTFYCQVEKRSVFFDKKMSKCYWMMYCSQQRRRVKTYLLRLIPWVMMEEGWCWKIFRQFLN